ncbi:MAG: acyl transferase domain-containing protein/acyl carrier protein [Acidimicrobiales bacterium]
MQHNHDSKRPAIAVVGVSALFPGSVDSTGFWDDILSGADRMTDVPASHWLIEDHYDSDMLAPDKTYGRRGGFLDPIDLDLMKFGIPPVAVPSTDTAQLLALIVAQRVLDDAVTGQFTELDRTRASVILGVTSGQELLGAMASRMNRPMWLQGMRRAGVPEDVALAACEQIADLHPAWQESTFPGLLGNVVAGRIANRLDLGGTNCVTDAACASSFSALSMGVNELYLGDSDLVIAGGVDTMNDIFMYMCFSKTPALSQSEDIRPFSDKADGTMLGEGIGMVALKRLEDAERDGNHIYCVVNAVGASSDGRSKSVYAPVSEGQARALTNTYAKAGYQPDTVELVEAHGTGTVAGDAAEFGGLELAFDGSGRADRQWCALGSVKSQIGHTKAAAGAAGLFKVIMALHHKVLPQTAKIDQPNPKLDLKASPFYLNTTTRPWVRPSGHERRGSVSSFGFGGSNFHVAMSEYLGPGVRAPRLRTTDVELVVLQGTDGSDIVAKARELLGSCSTDGYLQWLAHSTQATYDPDTAARLAIVATDGADLETKLLAAIERIAADPTVTFSTPTKVHYGIGAHTGDVAFVFPGQGSQYLGMGSGLATQFNEAMGPWDVAADLDWDTDSLQSVVFPATCFEDGASEQQEAMLTATQWAQPAIGATSLSYLRVLRQIGLEATHVGGHSFGEITALHAAGVFSEADTLRVARRRGELMAEAARIPGAMTAVAAGIEDVRALVDQSGIDVVVANHNHHSQVVLSGPTPAIDAIEVMLGSAALTFKRLPVATAFHSPVVSGASGSFTQSLDSISFAAAAIPVYANETATVYPTGDAAVRDQLGRQLANSVRFVEMIQAMYDSGARTFVEVGPGSTLAGLISRILDGDDHAAIALDKKKASGLGAFLGGLAQLAARGVPMDLGALWKEYADIENPAETVAPKLTIAISGANHGKPYPPEDRTKLVGPNPLHSDAPPAPGAATTVTPPPVASTPVAPQPVAPSPVAPSPVAPSPVAPSPVAPSPAAPQPAPPEPLPPPVAAAAPTPDRPRPMVTPQPSAPASVHVNGAAPSTGVLAAYQSVQQHTAEAHAEYLRTTALAHTAFMTASQQGLAVLGQLAGGSVLAPAIVAAPPPAALAPAITPAPAPIPVQPTAPAPAPPPVASAPVASAPVASAPVASAPVAPVPVATAPPPPSPPVAAAPPPPPAAAPAANATAPAGQTLTSDELMALLLSVVADKTGYPSEMLTMDMELEGDLGIDSIKRVEILSAMQDEVPSLPEVDTSVMAELVTLGQIVDYMFGQINGGGTPPFDGGAFAPAAATSAVLGRFRLRAIAANPSGEALRGLQGSSIAVIDDYTGVAAALVELLVTAGLSAALADAVDDSIDGVIFLGGLRRIATVDEALAVNHQAFETARALATGPKAARLLVTVSDLGGDFGIGTPNDVHAWSAGLTGLIRTAAIEWPDTGVRAIDIERADRDAGAIAVAIADELLTGGTELEVGLAANGTRTTLYSELTPVIPGAASLDASDVVVVSGGGRGVTAATMIELARSSGATFALLGRSVLADEPPSCAAVADDAGLKKVLLAEATAAGERITPPVLARRSAQILAGREVRQTLGAIEEAGGRARYVAVDITNHEAVAKTLDSIRAELGPITAVVHGAGVLADKLIADKSDAAFASVFDTKVLGLRVLLDTTRDDELKVLCVFSSVAARTGNRGQVDYAMANEILNKVAVAERARRGPECVVKSFGWGPWDGGMVSPSLKTHFEAMGTTLIPLDAGSRMLVDELSSPQTDEVELVLGGGVLPDNLVTQVSP